MADKINLDYFKKNERYIYSPLARLTNAELEDFYKDSEQVIKKYSYYYHPVRTTLIDWYDFKEDAELLEVNGALGALTEYFCKKVKNVTTIEFAVKNAKIIEHRLRDKDNLEIIVGDLQDIKLEKKFDYIFISDALIAAKMFFDSNRPEYDFVEYFKKLLKPDGVLIMSVMNRYAIKNWCGTMDEYTGIMYDALLNYESDKNVAYSAYSKPELEQLFGTYFNYFKFYYPLPDSFDVYQLLSDSTMEMLDRKDIPSYMMSTRMKTLLNQSYLMNHLYTIGKFDFFANSFLIFAGNSKPAEEVVYAKTVKNSITKIVETSSGKYARKIPLTDLSRHFFERIYPYYLSETRRLHNSGINNVKLANCKKSGDGLVFEFVPGKKMDVLAYEAINQRDEAKLFELFRCFKDMIYSLYPDRVKMDFETSVDSQLERIFGKIKIKNTDCVKDANYDINLSNVFKDGDNYTLIDYDKVCPHYIPIDYIVYKALSGIFNPYKEKVKDMFKRDEYEAFREMIKNYSGCEQKDKYFM